jgi:hypothetical protein
MPGYRADAMHAPAGDPAVAGKDRGMELPHRIRGVASTGPLSPTAPVLPPELRHRMQAAVTAERAEAAARERERAARHHAAGPLGHVRPSSSAPGRKADQETSPPEGGPEPVSRSRPGRARRRTVTWLAALGVAIIAVGSLAATAADPFSRPPAAQAAVRAQAAAWVAGQVSPDVTVSCDAVMCAALRAHGFPAGKLVMLGPASPDPVPSDLVVETSAVRALLGDSLAVAWAPAVLASFGSGTGVITVRLVAPHGAAAYQASLGAGLAGRRRSGAALLDDPRITMSAAARGQLAAGQVDPRLLLALASLAGHQPVDIVRFEDPGPGASPGIPLRFADLAASIPSAHLDTAAYTSAALAVLRTAAARIGPARVVSGTLQGRAALQIQFTAPSPLETTGLGDRWFRRGPAGRHVVLDGVEVGRPVITPGQGLARMEAHALLAALAGQVERIDLVGPATAVLNNLINARASVPVTLTPARSAGI